ncbi:MAG: tetratricopeptide repeat protein [Alloprevotella sp.]|nr:tetratricopeptide repeat protein [Alloprevotella sp.]
MMQNESKANPSGGKGRQDAETNKNPFDFDVQDVSDEIVRREAEAALLAHRLRDALFYLRALSRAHSFGGTRDGIEELYADYERMLDYWESGVDDPARPALYRQFLNRCAYWLSCIEFSMKYVCLANMLDSSHAGTSIRWETLDSILDAPDGDERIFARCVLSPPLGKSDSDVHLDMFQNPEVPQSRKLTAVSGLTLSLLHVFDDRKLSFLLDFAQDADLTLRARCLVGAMFVCVAWPKRIAFYPELASRISLLLDEPAFVADVRTVQLQFLLSLNTSEDSRKIDNEILPEMFRAAREVVERREKDPASRGIVDSSDWEALEMKFNPDWTAGENDSIRHTMHEFMALQEKGADIFYNNFAKIAGYTNFFRRASSWFVPFRADHPALAGVKADSGIFDFFFKMRPICNTEKYAYVLLFEKFSQQQAQGLSDYLQNMRERFHGEEGGVEDDEQGADPLEAFRTEVRSYVQDFYRFSFLYWHHDDKYRNPFKMNLHFADCPLFAPLTQSPDFLAASADYCFSARRWEEAQEYLRRLPEEERDAEIYEKMGYCCSQLQDDAEAAEYFERALILRPESRWTLRQIARTHIRRKQYRKALDVLTELESLEPESVDTLLRLGECAILCGLSDMAFEKLYKADYLHSDDRTQRALAWCSLCFRRTEEAEKYYERLLAGKPTPSDWYNAGHCAWMAGDIKKAVGRYAQRLKVEDLTYAQDSFFDEDRDVLIGLGFSEDELNFMRDAINRSLS